jgi:beta-N-acetylhexosaminidase
MVAHVSYPQLDPSGRPATFSAQILSGLLREQMGFDGLIMTDDVEMQGARTLKSADLRAVAAVSAGADIVMVAWNRHSQYAALEGLRRALLRGQISKERIQLSLDRILSAKARLEVPAMPSRSELRALVFHRELYAVIDQVLIQNIRQSFFSTPLLGRDIVILTDDPTFAAGLKRATRGEGLIVESLTPKSAAHLAKVLSAYPKHVSLFLQFSNRQNLQSLFELPQSLRHRIVVVSSELPSRLRDSGGFRQAILSYSRHPNFGELFGNELRRLLTAQRSPTSLQKTED